MAKKTLSSNEIINTIDAYVSDVSTRGESSRDVDSSRAYDLYFGTYPKQTTRGRNKHVSLDVHDMVHAVQADLLNIFSSSKAAATFVAHGYNDKAQAEDANLAVDFMLNSKNIGYKIHSDTIFDGLMAKMGVTKTYLHEEQTSADFPFIGTEDQLDLMLAEMEELDKDVSYEETDEPQITIGQFGETVTILTGTITEEVTEFIAKVDVIPPEEFLIDNAALNTKDAAFTAHVRKATKGELREMGFKESKIKKISSGGGSRFNSTVSNSRNQMSNSDSGTNIGDESMQYVSLKECYLVADYKGDGLPTMKQIFVVDNVILEKNDVSRNPFLGFVPFPISHKLYGQGIADKIGDIQVQKSRIMRAALDNTEMNNNTRVLAQRDMFENPRDLTDTRFDGVAWTKGPPNAAIQEMTRPNLANQTFEMLEQLNQEKEQRVGKSRLSQGLNEDALKPGNAASKIHSLLDKSQTIMKMVALNYGFYYEELMTLIYEVVVDNRVMMDIPNPSGEPVTMDPVGWKTKRIAKLTDNVSLGEAEARAQNLLQLDTKFSSDPTMGDIYTPENRYATLSNALSILGEDANIMLTRPRPKEERDAAAAQQAQKQDAVLQKQIELETTKAETDRMKVENDITLGDKKHNLDRLYKTDEIDVKELNAKTDREYKTDLIDVAEQRIELDKIKVSIEAILEEKQNRGVDIG